MAANEPIDPRVRLAISQWPEDAPRGAVSTFCAEQGISRKSFYELRERAKSEGPAAVLEPRSRRPRSTPSQLTEEVKTQALQVRAALESSGLDHGPISVHDKMKSMGLALVTSIASLARIFRQAGVARLEPKKKPRSAWRRFVYPAPNACWQLDATEYVLTGGRKCVVFQLIDDHSRYAVASHVAWGETAAAAITVFDKAVAAHGVPQRLLSDNGLALNPSRRGHLGQLVVHAMSLGVEPITGKPYKPTTQGKNERFHQTLFRYLDKQPWVATDKAEAPRPSREQLARPRTYRPAPTPVPAPSDLPDDTQVRKLTSTGVFMLDNVFYMVGRRHGFQQVLVITDGTNTGDKVTITDLHGEILIEHKRPAPGITYVGNGRPRGRRPNNPEPLPKS